VQYEGEINESVIALMEALAKVKVMVGQEIFFGVINRDDSYRLRLALSERLSLDRTPHPQSPVYGRDSGRPSLSHRVVNQCQLRISVGLLLKNALAFCNLLV
jgi:hypothetical protein